MTQKKKIACVISLNHEVRKNSAGQLQFMEAKRSKHSRRERKREMLTSWKGMGFCALLDFLFVLLKGLINHMKVFIVDIVENCGMHSL